VAIVAHGSDRDRAGLRGFGITVFEMRHGRPFGGMKASGVARATGPERFAESIELKSAHLPDDWVASGRSSPECQR
jgi:acyl-CoA reductase-like NAD-dependent aldehyde dehydrogenase